MVIYPTGRWMGKPYLLANTPVALNISSIYCIFHLFMGGDKSDTYGSKNGATNPC